MGIDGLAINGNLFCLDGGAWFALITGKAKWRTWLLDFFVCCTWHQKLSAPKCTWVYLCALALENLKCVHSRSRRFVTSHANWDIFTPDIPTLLFPTSVCLAKKLFQNAGHHIWAPDSPVLIIDYMCTPASQTNCPAYRSSGIIFDARHLTLHIFF